MSVVSVVLSGRGLCDELITRPEESYLLWCVVACDLETSKIRRPWPALGRSVIAKKKVLQLTNSVIFTYIFAVHYFSVIFVSSVPKRFLSADIPILTMVRKNRASGTGRLPQETQLNAVSRPWSLFHGWKEAITPHSALVSKSSIWLLQTEIPFLLPAHG